MTPRTFTPHDYAITPREGKAAVDAWCWAHDVDPIDVSLVEWPGEPGAVNIEISDRDQETGHFVTAPDGGPVRHHLFLNERTPFPWEQVVTVEDAQPQGGQP